MEATDDLEIADLAGVGTASVDRVTHNRLA